MAMDTSTTPEPAPARGGRRVSLRDQAYEAIKQRIVRCDLRPGEVITVVDLAEQLRLGRTPILQAIDRLTVDGLVSVMPRKGIVVAPVSLDELVEIVEVRLLNEGQAARWAADRASPGDVGRLDANLDATWKAARSNDVDAMIGLDREFHRLLSAAAGNAILAEFLANLHDRSLRFWFISLRSPDHNIRVCEQHAAIVEGVRKHDPEQAEAAMRAHITAFRQNLTGQVSRN
ncbi:GntR family transcriptional regulator [Amaricoccus sp.]|uniref:GntR family transcriptional regulator n=1 Tax=Amaricoccus sp. TaxID=1872485 RepID=UPI001D79EC5D|nr:GntR family transcriptional regulator [Amaricoccus sp.]MCB1404039.1 GntR family transcriptional regulator [Paracoccaceae bacterium]MCB1464788.1 GntR family transcriptional regulator [Nitratireductor sp.]MCC0065806.1 GntR family transcriptional regulator [Rhodovulum sp.]HRW14291.1 GntR family transcriptional regulator [Amaricoccus sp.]